MSERIFERTFWRVKIWVRYKKKGFWGRFGGGWDWAVGFRIGGRSLLLDLLIFAVMISIVDPKKGGEK